MRRGLTTPMKKQPSRINNLAFIFIADAFHYTTGLG